MAQSHTRKKIETAPSFQDFEEQGAIFHGLKTAFLTGHGIHAYLFCGSKGIGKKTLAHLCAQTLFCKAQGQDKPCGICPPCIRFLDENHPDAMVVKGEKSILVDAIRQIVKAVGGHTYEGGRRAVIIENAEKMTTQAQNSLLKTLEEPNEDTVFFLISDDVTLLLPTIVSRCRVMRMHPWSDEYVERTLIARGIDPDHANRSAKVSSGSIGAALAVAGDASYWEMRKKLMDTVFSMSGAESILLVSSQMKDDKDRSGEILDTIEEMLRELLLARLNETLLQEEYPPLWQKMAKEADVDVFHRLLQAVFDARRLKASQVNWQAVLEMLLLRMTEECIVWQR